MSIVKKLRRCKTKDEVYNLFKDFGISSDDEKKTLILKAMWEPIMFHEYDVDLYVDILLMGDHKLNELYEKMGL